MILSELVVKFLVSPDFSLLRRLLVVGFIILITLILAHLFNRFMRSQFAKMRKIHKEHPEVHYDPTKYLFLRRFVQLLIYLLGFGAIIYIVPHFRTISYSIFVGAGVFAVILGFAAQKVFANMIAGISLATSEPIRVGDKVTVDTDYGTIEDITLRHVILRTWDNNRIVIPNSLLNDAKITNHSLGGENIIQTVEMGISYDSDIDLAKRILREVIIDHKEALAMDAGASDFFKLENAISIRVVECGESAVKLRAYFMVKDKPTGIITSFEILEEAKKHFDDEGIVIPFPQRTTTSKREIDARMAKKMKAKHAPYMPRPAKKRAAKKVTKKKVKKKSSKRK